MRCSKCGRRLNLLTHFCAKCGTAVSPKQRKKALIVLCIWLVVFLGLIPAFYFPLREDKNMLDFTNLHIFYIAIATAMVISSLLFLVYSIIAGIVRFIKHQPIFGSIIVGAVLLLIGFGTYLYYTDYQSNNYLKSLTLIQDNLSEVTAAKIMGDSLMENKPITGASWERVKIEGQLVSNRLKDIMPPKELVDYHRAALAWSNDIFVGSQNGEAWKKLAADPGAFKMEISDKQAIELFTISSKKIAELKEFGDEAIKMNNQIAMLYIGAKLRTQRHFLNGVLYSSKSGGLSFLSIPFISTANAALPPATNIPEVGGGCAVDVEYYNQTGITRCKSGSTPTKTPTPTQPATPTKTNVPAKPVLTPITQPTGGTSGGTSGQIPTGADGTGVKNQIQNPEQYNIGSTGNTATNKSGVLAGWEYVVPRKICIGRGGVSTQAADGKATNVYCIEDAVQSTNEIEASAINFAQGDPNAKNGWDNGWHNAQEAGLTIGEPTTSGRGPAVQAFYDACAAKGGIVGGTGGAKTRLPTTESGYTCNYKNGQTTGCWDYLTYSGGRYQGGNPGCAEQGLLPNVDEARAKAKNANGGKWDGRYAGQIIVECVSNLPDNPKFSSPFPMDFPVVNNVTFDPEANAYVSIDDSGYAIESFQMTQSTDFATVYLYSTNYFHFNMTDKGVVFTVSGSMDVNAVRKDGTFFGTCTVKGSGTMK